MEVQQIQLGEKPEDETKNGPVLNDELVSSCISLLGRLGNGMQYQQLTLPGYDLVDVSILSLYVHLQRLELPNNKIKDLSCVSNMPYLVILDASHNELTHFFGFEPLKNLKEVNFSHNRITTMKDLSAFSSLTKLELDHNGFGEISGLQQCCLLNHLSLAHNRISRISGLDYLPLSHLNLRANRLVKIEGLENLMSLQLLDLGLNRITSLSGLQNLHLLGSIDLENNLVSEIQECKHIHDLYLLRDINLVKNPIQEAEDYRQSVVFLLQHLTMLDQQEVTAEEKVTSVNKYDPPVDVVASRDHMTQLVYQLMQPQVLCDRDSPYPMLVLTGPQGCGKRELVHCLCQDLSEYFGYGICHTTRQPYFGEKDGIDYHFVSEEEFQSMIPMGKFIQTMHYGGHRYGLTRDAVEDVAREGVACCVHMELEGVLSMKNSIFEPRYVLLIPSSEEKYTDTLNNRGLYTPEQIAAAASRIRLYADMTAQRPGFFDDVILCDDWERTYPTLRQIVREYLSLHLLEEHDDDEGRGAPPDGQGRASEEKPPSPDTDPPLDPNDPAYRNYLVKIQEELCPEKTPNELASIGRREQLVREAVVGKSPGVYSQFPKRSIRSSALSTALQQLISSVQSHDSSPDDQNSPTHKIDPGILFGPGSASEEAPCFPSHSPVTALVEALDIAASNDTVEAVKDQLDSEQGAVTPPPSSERRPGSDVKPVLPPIPSGRKMSTAASSCHSSGLSSSATGLEDGEGSTELQL